MVLTQAPPPRVATAVELVALLGSRRYLVSTERELQDEIEGVLSVAGVAYERERSLGARDRPDFLVGAGAVSVAVEVKTAGGWTDVARQVQRYLAYRSVSSAVLVTTKATHRRVGGDWGGKAVHIVEAWRCL